MAFALTNKQQLQHHNQYQAEDLTKDAIQKKAEDYGKFLNGNKLYYADFQNYLDKNQPIYLRTKIFGAEPPSARKLKS